MGIKIKRLSKEVSDVCRICGRLEESMYEINIVGVYKTLYFCLCLSHFKKWHK